MALASRGPSKLFRPLFEEEVEYEILMYGCRVGCVGCVFLRESQAYRFKIDALNLTSRWSSCIVSD